MSRTIATIVAMSVGMTMLGWSIGGVCRAEEPTGGTELIVMVFGNTGLNVTITVSKDGTTWNEDFEIEDIWGTAKTDTTATVSLEFNHVTSNGGTPPLIGFGKYSINIYIPSIGVNRTCFADFTDCDYPYYGGSNADMQFEYTISTDILRETVVYDDGPLTLVGNDQGVAIWDNGNKPSGTPSTACFEPGPPSQLTVTPYTPPGDVSHPRLAWNASAGPYLTGYKVYRNYNGQGFVNIGSPSSSPYVDGGVTWFGDGGNTTAVQYYVKAINNAKLSTGSTNTVEIKINQYIQKPFAEGAVPHVPALHPNFPNPFNPSTKIEFDVARAGRVVLRVFDLLGREVQTLIDDEIQSGRYSVVFHGQMLGSGMYLLRMDMPGFSTMHTMTLIK